MLREDVERLEAGRKEQEQAHETTQDTLTTGNTDITDELQAQVHII